MTYLFGYDGKRLTLAQLEERQTWARLHPELRRRLIAMFGDACNVGVDVGLGQGWHRPSLGQVSRVLAVVVVVCSYRLLSAAQVEQVAAVTAPRAEQRHQERRWQPPTPYPGDGNLYTWDETTLAWEPVT